MGPLLEALVKLQSVEGQLSHVRSRLNIRKKSIGIQQKHIEQAQEDHDSAHRKIIGLRKKADSLELDLKQKEEHTAAFRASLNIVKTNKEYSTLLVQINTNRADSAKLEEEVLETMQRIDAEKIQEQELLELVEKEEAKLQRLETENAEELQKLTAMMEDLTSQRDDASKDVPASPLEMFNRLSEKYDGEAMAKIDVDGKKPPYSYSCGGCFMGLSAEHYNALASRDEIRICDNCERILYYKKDEAF